MLIDSKGLVFNKSLILPLGTLYCYFWAKIFFKKINIFVAVGRVEIYCNSSLFKRKIAIISALHMVNWVPIDRVVGSITFVSAGPALKLIELT